MSASLAPMPRIEEQCIGATFGAQRSQEIYEVPEGKEDQLRQLVGACQGKRKNRPSGVDSAERREKRSQSPLSKNHNTNLILIRGRRVNIKSSQKRGHSQYPIRIPALEEERSAPQSEMGDGKKEGS